MPVATLNHPGVMKVGRSWSMSHVASIGSRPSPIRRCPTPRSGIAFFRRASGDAAKLPSVPPARYRAADRTKVSVLMFETAGVSLISDPLRRAEVVKKCWRFLAMTDSLS